MTNNTPWIALDGDEIFHLSQETYHFLVPVSYERKGKIEFYWSIITGYVSDEGRIVVQCDDNADCGWEPDDVTHYMPVAQLPDIEELFY